jgi:hypothetical protein
MTDRALSLRSLRCVLAPSLLAAALLGARNAGAQDGTLARPTQDAVLSPARPAPDEGERPKNVFGHELFSAGAALELVGRQFSYSDGISSNVRDYGVFGAPMPVVFLELYPAAETDIPVMRDIGLVASYGHAIGLDSETSDGRKVGNTYDRIMVGLRARLRTGGVKSPVFGLTTAFTLVAFGFDTTGALNEEVPSVSYKNLRIGLDGRVPFGPVSLLLSAGYDAPLTTGAVYDRFRDPSTGGIDLGAGLAVRIVRGLEARATVEYTRYFSSFDPRVGDSYVAGGALDEFLGIRIGAAYAY